MAMIRISTTFNLALLLAAGNLHAQDTPADNSAEILDNQPASVFVQEGQIVPVAEEGIDDFDIPEHTDENALLNEFELYKQLMQDGVLDEADSVAKRVVELAIRIKGPQSSEFAKALTNLAIVQFQTGQYDAAQQNFESAIEIIEDNEDRLNAQLVNPLKGLGASQLESGRPDLATGTFKRAVHVTHVNEGPHNLDQVELLESMAETYVRMGDFDSAKQAQDSIYALNIRKHGADTLGLLPSMMRRAEWQERAGFLFDTRTTYRRIIRVIEENIGRNALELVEPLIKLGRSFFFIDTSGMQSYQEARLSTGELYFRRAARIAEDHPETNWQIIAQARLALGDFYIFINNGQRARQIYRDIWTLLSEDEAQLQVRHEQLGKATRLKGHKMPQYFNDKDADAALQTDDPLLQGRLTISYEISTRGRADSLKLVEAQPEEFEKMLTAVIREMRQRVYRPKLEDGQVVTTAGQLLTHKYFYRQSDLDAVRAAAAAEEKE